MTYPVMNFSGDVMLEQQERFLPFSGRRYKINVFGEIFDGVGEKIKTYVKDDQVYVDLVWVLGVRPYLVSTLVLITFTEMSLPEHLWDKLVPLYVDGDPTNLAPTNLLYRFKNGPLEVEDRPGFFYVPFHTRYAINREGVLVALFTNSIMTWTVSKPCEKRNSTGGYRYCRVVVGPSSSRGLLRHRALCLTFKPYEANVSKAVVNHINGIPGDDRLENLEWTTHAENNRHARENRLAGKNIPPILVKDLLTGEVTRYPNIHACARGVKRVATWVISWRLRKGNGRVKGDMLVFKYDDGSDWPVFSTVSKDITSLGRTILARNVFTGDVLVFNNVSECGETLGVSSAVIRKHCKTETKIPFNGYNFRFLSSNVLWPEHTKRHLDIYKKYPCNPTDGVIVIDEVEGKELFFVGVKEASAEFGLSIPYLFNYMARNHLLKGRYRFKAFKLRETIGPFTE